MKKIILFGFTLLIIVTMAGCSNNNDQTVEKNKQQQQATWKSEMPVNINAEDSLHSVHFIDPNTGWLVKNENKDNEQISQILHTKDSGKNWKEIKIGNFLIKQLLFIDKTTGWVITQTGGKDDPNKKKAAVKIMHTNNGGRNWEL
ncbi:MAG: hypothetical protein K9L17_01040 [Clostridiales bacterium]|nr:hypothetical protein [Clostridiales bacterium]MCF8021278.1 hypothetical protein [Clostridiales bacterium]